MALNRIVELKKEWVFARALINKQCYQPYLVPVEAIYLHFQCKDVEDMGVFSEIFCVVEYFIRGIKELE